MGRGGAGRWMGDWVDEDNVRLDPYGTYRIDLQWRASRESEKAGLERSRDLREWGVV